MKESEIEVVWTREETRPIIYLRRKKDSGDGTTWEKMMTEAEMDDLCQPRHKSYRHNKR